MEENLIYKGDTVRGMYTLDVFNPDKLYFTSDTHFGHFNICKYCHRPFSSRADMDKTLLANWNKTVPEDGVVVHCGDFMLSHKVDTKAYLKYMWKLNGKILLLRGNHDYIDLNTEENEKLIAVVDKAFIMVDGVKIYAEHYPCTAFNGDYQVFGHIHTLKDGTCYGIDADVTSKLRKNQYDVGMDQNGYRPISYWEVCDIFRKKACNKDVKHEH